MQLEGRVVQAARQVSSGLSLLALLPSSHFPLLIYPPRSLLPSRSSLNPYTHRHAVQPVPVISSLTDPILLTCLFSLTLTEYMVNLDHKWAKFSRISIKTYTNVPNLCNTSHCDLWIPLSHHIWCNIHCRACFRSWLVQKAVQTKTEQKYMKNNSI